MKLLGASMGFALNLYSWKFVAFQLPLFVCKKIVCLIIRGNKKKNIFDVFRILVIINICLITKYNSIVIVFNKQIISNSIIPSRLGLTHCLCQRTTTSLLAKQHGVKHVPKSVSLQPFPILQHQLLLY